jgi:hypothetical protein
VGDLRRVRRHVQPEAKRRGVLLWLRASKGLIERDSVRRIVRGIEGLTPTDPDPRARPEPPMRYFEVGHRYPTTIGRLSEAGVGFGGLDVRECKWSENCMTQMME